MVKMARRSRLRAVGDVRPAGWVAERVGPFGSGVGALVPHGFEAYARVLHPAVAADDRPVRWSAVARWSGRTTHPLVQFDAVSSPAPGGGRGPRPWETDPEPGSLPPAPLAALCDVLAAHTTSAGRCWFCIWDGYGRYETAFPPSVLDGPRVELPERTFFLLEGPLDAAGELNLSIYPQSPNVFWPDDHAWCVTTDVDLDSTYLGGTVALVADLLADDRLEALPVGVNDPVWRDSDEVNR